MKPELKKKWVKALRSGEYIQGRGQLHNNLENSYCCLGVLCKVAGVKETGISQLQSVFGEEGSIATLQFDLTEKFCLNEKVQLALMRKNDSEEKSFSEIADWIEKNL